MVISWALETFVWERMCPGKREGVWMGGTRVVCYHSRKSPFSLIPRLSCPLFRCSALSTTTGSAEEYFNALAKCWPPQPELPDLDP